MAGQTTNYLFDYPTSTDYVKDGATAIQTLATDVDTTLFTAIGGAYPGLRLVKKQAVGTGVASVTVTGAFSATYDNYKIVYADGVASTIMNIAATLGSTATGYSSSRIYNTPSSGTPAGNGTSGTASWGYFGGGSTNYVNVNCDVLSPFKSQYTRYNGVYMIDDGVNTTFGTTQGFLNNTTSYTAFTLTAGGTFTGGNIYVYGYGAS